jgi:hypothetical protein
LMLMLEPMLGPSFSEILETYPSADEIRATPHN